MHLEIVLSVLALQYLLFITIIIWMVLHFFTNNQICMKKTHLLSIIFASNVSKENVFSEESDNERDVTDSLIIEQVEPITLVQGNFFMK